MDDQLDFVPYDGRPLLRGDVINVNIFFEKNPKKFRVCDVLTKKNKETYIVFDRKSKKEYLATKDIIFGILEDEDYKKRRKDIGKPRFYWEI